MKTAGKARICWRRFVSIPKGVKTEYARISGRKLTTQALRSDPQLRPWIADGPFQGADAYFRKGLEYSAENEKALGIWLGKFGNYRSFCSDLRYLSESGTDFYVIKISPATAQERKELTQELNKPLQGIMAYKVKGEILLLSADVDIITQALKPLASSLEIGFERIKGNRNIDPAQVASAIMTQQLPIKDFISLINYEKAVDYLEEFAIVSRTDLLSSITAEGGQWAKQIGILQDGLLDIIRAKHGDSLTVKEFQDCVVAFYDQYRTGLEKHFERLEKATHNIQIRFPDKLVKIPLKGGQRAVFVGDIHQNLENLRKIFDHYHEALKEGRVILVLLGDYPHEAGISEETNLSSMTQSLETLDYLLEQMGKYPAAILPFRGNHDFADDFARGISKDDVFQGEIFLRTAGSLRGKKYLSKVQEFFETLPWSGMLITGDNRRIFAAHSFPSSRDGARELAASINQLQASDRNAVPLPERITDYKLGSGLNPFNLLWGRDFLEEDSPLMDIFQSASGGMDLLIFGHTFMRFADDAECYRFYEKDGNYGYILQSYLSALRVIEVGHGGDMSIQTI
jgi:tetratricopeptide (TPR) repeat protein